MKKFLRAIWYASPSSIYNYIKVLLSAHDRGGSQPDWHTVEAGPGTGLKVWLDVDSFSGWRSMLDGDYDSFMFDAVMGEPVRNIFDIGAHFGYSALIFSRIFEYSKVWAFEPNSLNFEHLVKHIHGNNLGDRILPYELAVSEKVGTLKFAVSDDVLGSQSTGSFIKGVMTPLSAQHYQSFYETEVTSTTIDELIRKRGLPIPDLIKIDVEGAEFQVLQGAKNTLQLNSPILLIEIHNVKAMFDCLGFLAELGYGCRLLDLENMTTSRGFIECKKKG